METRKRRPSTRRVRNFETLSDRRMLAVAEIAIAEGSLFEAETTVELENLAGQISGSFVWGDGSSSPATIVGGSASGAVSIRIDYSLDSQNFFADPQRREVLQAAADSLAARLGDDLSGVEIDSPHLTWRPSVIHPSQGGSDPNSQVVFDLPINPVVNAGEIVVFVGSRDFSGGTLGLGGAGGNAFNSSFTASSQAEADSFQAAIDADIREVQGRGQAGADGDFRTDVAVNFGSIAFDSNASRFYFGNGEIQSSQVDFFAVAQHELAHVLGFGEQRGDIETSWERLTRTGEFVGDASGTIFQNAGGIGDVPLADLAHWSALLPNDFGVDTILTSTIPFGVEAGLSPLDFAALEDLGWEIQTNQFTATGSYHFGDDGIFTPILVLTGSSGGQQTVEVAEVTVFNVAPLVDSMTVEPALQGELFAATLATFVDPGFGNIFASPPSQETFAAQIDWGDGVIETVATDITTVAQAGVTGEGTVSGIHVYDEPGTYVITISVSDDDDGFATTTTTIEVFSATAFQNDRDPLDVNNDGEVDLLDALRNVNELRRRASLDQDGRLDPRVFEVESDGLFDVDGDGTIAPLDLLLVINELRRRQSQPQANLLQANLLQASQSQAGQSQASQALINQASADQASADQALINQASADQASADQALINQASADQAPAIENDQMVMIDDIEQRDLFSLMDDAAML